MHLLTDVVVLKNKESSSELGILASVYINVYTIVTVKLGCCHLLDLCFPLLVTITTLVNIKMLGRDIALTKIATMVDEE